MKPPNQILTLAYTLSALPRPERRDHVASAVIESGGVYPVDVPENMPFEIQIAGHAAIGHSEDAAIDAWITSAIQDAEEVEDDGYITVHPRPQRNACPEAAR